MWFGIAVIAIVLYAVWLDTRPRKKVHLELVPKEGEVLPQKKD